MNIDKFQSKQVDGEGTASQSDDVQASFEEVFLEYWPRVYRVIYLIVGEHAEAEDLALDVFWQMYQKPPRDQGNLPGWLYRSATNKGFNALRSNKRREKYEQEAGRTASVAVPPLNPAEEVEQAEERAQVRRVLSQMKPRAAKLLILRHSGLSYIEIADALEVKFSSVGTMLVRAEREFERRYRRLEGE